MVKNYKGYSYTGSSILGYRLAPLRDYGKKQNMSLEVKQTGVQRNNDYNCNKTLRKVTYRKFLKSANRR